MAGSKQDVVVTGLALDSRLVEVGNLFAALSGEISDGRDYIPDALKAGANSILLPVGSNIDEAMFAEAVVLSHDNPRLALAQMAGRFYSPQPKYLAAITGTNGKTSVASFVKQLWLSLGYEPASMGTMGVESSKINKAGGLTTPDTISFHRNLQELAKAGVDHVVFEASSHGLSQYRLDGVEISVAGFTNLSREHLDYHGDMERYFAAKSRLFVELLAKNGVAVINVDCKWGRKLALLCEANNKRLISIGAGQEANVSLLKCDEQGDGYACQVSYLNKTYDFKLPLIGRFQLDNALMAAGMVLASGADATIVFATIEKLTGVDGRMELAGVSLNGARVLVDYAHTPDGLDRALTSLQSYRDNGRLFVVFGCGGNRDKGKRLIMGKIAGRLADEVFVTDDNPRNEDPKEIRAEILSGVPTAHEFADRAKAIEAAVAQLEGGDILLVTGKGHEQGQIIGDKVLPFSDLKTVKAAVANLGASK